MATAGLPHTLRSSGFQLPIVAVLHLACCPISRGTSVSIFPFGNLNTVQNMTIPEKSVTSVATTKDLGLYIRNARKTMNLQQADAALLCGVGVRFLSDLENGKETVRLGSVLKVIAGLGLALAVARKQPFWIQNDRST